MFGIPLSNVLLRSYPTASKQDFAMLKQVWFWLAVAALLAVTFWYSQSNPAGSPQAVAGTPNIALLVGGETDPFWQRVADGATKAAEVYGAKIEVIVPSDGGDDQTMRLITLDADKYDGIAVSPMQPKKQSRPISVLATRTKVVTFDNDAPDSVRHAYIGTNNYVSGVQCGRILLDALPEGGRVAIFVGDHDRENSKLRRQGFIDALKGENRRPGDDLDPLGEPITAGPYTIVATYLDGGINETAKANALRVLEDDTDLKAMVGLYGHNAPMCLAALKEAGKLGEVQVVAFDGHKDTLAAIEAGHAAGTVVQEPYQYGFESVRILVALANGEFQPHAGRGSFNIPCVTVTASNVAELRAKIGSL